jgi:hypothetical protein
MRMRVVFEKHELYQTAPREHLTKVQFASFYWCNVAVRFISSQATNDSKRFNIPSR